MALELFTGFLNTLQWYPWPFPFKQTHYALAWIIVGALLVHLAVKLPLILTHWRRTPADRAPIADSLPPAITGLTRRGLFRTVAGAATLVGITSVGQSVPALGPIAVLAPRKPNVGPQGLPINRTAKDAGVTGIDADWRFTITGPRQLSYTLDELRQPPAEPLRPADRLRRGLESGRSGGKASGSATCCSLCWCTARLPGPRRLDGEGRLLRHQRATTGVRRRSRSLCSPSA